MHNNGVQLQCLRNTWTFYNVHTVARCTLYSVRCTVYTGRIYSYVRRGGKGNLSVKCRLKSKKNYHGQTIERKTNRRLFCGSLRWERKLNLIFTWQCCQKKFNAWAGNDKVLKISQRNINVIKSRLSRILCSNTASKTGQENSKRQWTVANSYMENWLKEMTKTTKQKFYLIPTSEIITKKSSSS